jgi:large subunit ribosomal protein L4
MLSKVVVPVGAQCSRSLRIFTASSLFPSTLSFPVLSRRLLSTNLEYAPFVVKVGDETISIPPNLQLADVQVLKKPEKPVNKISMSFPLLKVPETIDVKSWTPGGEITTIPLDKTVFGVGIRPDIVHDLVCWVRNRQRQPKRTKRIGDLRGSNKKPRPQKKTGASQVGHRRNSAWRGGQKAHGPVLRDYSTGMPKKARALGLMMCLAAKHREGNLHIFDKLTAEVRN